MGLPWEYITLLTRVIMKPIYNDQLAAQLLKLPKKLPSRQPFLIHRSGGFHCHHAPDGTVAVSPAAPCGRGFASHGYDAGHAGEAQRWHHGICDLRCGGLGRDLRRRLRGLQGGPRKNQLEVYRVKVNTSYTHVIIPFIVS